MLDILWLLIFQLKYFNTLIVYVYHNLSIYKYVTEMRLTDINFPFCRMYDPTVDILAAKWSPFEEVNWVLPLQFELSSWRQKLMEMEESHFNRSDNIDILFITDFPGIVTKTTESIYSMVVDT